MMCIKETAAIAKKDDDASSTTIEKQEDSSMMEEERKRHISGYRATTKQCCIELATLFTAYFTLLWSHGAFPSIVPGPVFWVVAPLVHLRFFMMYHDLGHGSFCPSLKWNNRWHKLFSVLVMTPTRWRESHRRHHLYFGNTENEIGFQWNDTIFMTKTQLEALRPMVLQKFVRVMRYPLVFFPVAAFYEWYIRHRMVVLDPASGYTTRDNMINTLCVLTYAGSVGYMVGPWLVVDMVVSSYVSLILGLFLFHTQHSFEDGYRRPADQWNQTEASLHGSSCTLFPWFLKWTTMGIGYHHIHHLDTRVPGYLTQQCHEEGKPEYWKGVTVLNMHDFWDCLWTTVYDEKSGKFV